MPKSVNSLQTIHNRTNQNIKKSMVFGRQFSANHSQSGEKNKFQWLTISLLNSFRHDDEINWQKRVIIWGGRHVGQWNPKKTFSRKNPHERCKVVLFREAGGVFGKAGPIELSPVLVVTHGHESVPPPHDPELGAHPELRKLDFGLHGVVPSCLVPVLHVPVPRTRILRVRSSSNHISSNQISPNLAFWHDVLCLIRYPTKLRSLFSFSLKHHLNNSEQQVSRKTAWTDKFKNPNRYSRWPDQTHFPKFEIHNQTH